MDSKLPDIIKELNEFFVEREEEVTLLIVSLLSKQNALLVGPPGTAKSMLCAGVASHFRTKHFDWLLTKFSPPEELFGPLNIKMLEEGHYERNIADKLPSAETAFLDELFKSNSAILNSLLKIINERIYHNNGTPISVPLIAMWGASNELPADEDNLSALYDRLLLRKKVDYLSSSDAIQKMLHGSKKYSPKTTISKIELDAMIAEAEKVKTESIESDALEILFKLKTAGVIVSDRRFKDAMSVIRAVAYISGRSEAIQDDLAILQHIFWSKPDEIKIVQQHVLSVANPFANRALELDGVINDMAKAIKQFKEATPESFEIYNKIIKLKKQMESEIKKAKEAKKSTAALEKVKERTEDLIKHMRKIMAMEE